MKKLMGKMVQLWKDDEGATAVEYGLMLAGIAAAIVATVFALGGNLNTLFNTIDGRVIAGNTTAAGTAAP